ncbi:hypothetical protein [Streptomyces sp. NPDC018031]|uniref:hypothetical protein n=1 Tax=Streptomyces sp. NPDC018031 TaxID=3365033 RepID=UPI0037909AE3
MTDPDQQSARRRLDAALNGLTTTFRGMTARPDEHNCECHWGGPEELALLKVPDVELDPDLLRRTWQATDWTDHAAVLRRILPQFGTALVDGRIELFFGMAEVGHSFARADWRRWPARQAGAVREFLHAWWVRTLTEPQPAVPAYEVLAAVAEASATLTPWLGVWEALDTAPADAQLAEAAARWEYDLLGDELPWETREDAEDRRAELAGWLVRVAPPRLRSHGAPEELLHRVRLIGVTGADRWEDPHWPGHRY